MYCIFSLIDMVYNLAKIIAQGIDEILTNRIY